MRPNTHCRGCHVTPSIGATADVLEMSTYDDSIGICAQALPFIFEPFAQDVHANGFNGDGQGSPLS